MMTKLCIGIITTLTIAILPSAAFAEGAVKVECWGRCDLVNLGQICDTYALASQPVAIACDDTAVGSGTDMACGSGMTCRPFGNIVRSDLLSAYCADGGGYDATVTCRLQGTALMSEVTPPKVDDGAGQQENK